MPFARHLRVGHSDLAQISNPEAKKSHPRAQAVGDDHVTADGLQLPSRSAYREFVKSALSAIPTLFGRLTYIVALRYPVNEHYRHPDSAGAVEPQAVDDVLRQEHLEVFQAWLCLNLTQQTADLAKYFADQEKHWGEALKRWRQETQYTSLIPIAASPAEGELFRSDLEIVLTVISR
jgi:hypothetical protein